MRSEFAKWEIKTSVFSGRKSQAGNCCKAIGNGDLSLILFKLPIRPRLSLGTFVGNVISAFFKALKTFNGVVFRANQDPTTLGATHVSQVPESGWPLVPLLWASPNEPKFVRFPHSVPHSLERKRNSLGERAAQLSRQREHYGVALIAGIVQNQKIIRCRFGFRCKLNRHKEFCGH